jgi:hypothetical protein
MVRWRCRRAGALRLCSALVRNPFASPLWRNQAFEWVEIERDQPVGK